MSGWPADDAPESEEDEAAELAELAEAGEVMPRRPVGDTQGTGPQVRRSINTRRE